MQLTRLVGLLYGLLFLLSLIFTTITYSIDENSTDKINADFNMVFVSGTDLRISISADVNEITIYGTTKYDKNEIQALSTSSDPDDIEDMGSIKGILRQLLKEQIDSSFNNANVTALNKKPSYENYLFYDEYSVNLTSEFFGLNKTINAYDFINGVLDMDGVISYTFNFVAKPGWNNTYTLALMDSMNRPYTNGKVVGSNNVQWKVENGGGEQIKTTSAEIYIQMKKPTTSQPDAEDISIEFKLDTRNIETNSLKIEIVSRMIDISNYDILPDSVTNLNFVPSDGIRLFVENEIISWNDFYQKTVKKIEESIIPKVEESTFNQTLDTIFSWDVETTTNCSPPYDVENMDDTPPVKADLIDDDVDLEICNIPSEVVFGIINAGGKVNISTKDINFAGDFANVGYPYNSSIYLPSSIYLDGENVYTWNQSESISGEFSSDVASTYTKENKSTMLEIEMGGADLNLFKFFTGKTEFNVALDAYGTNEYRVAEIPSQFSLPEKISLKYMNSDVFRLCIEEGVFSEGAVDEFLNYDKDVFEERITEIFPNLKINGHADKESFENSLSWDGDISSMDDETPVSSVSYAHTQYPISFKISLIPPQFKISNQSFNLSGLLNQSATYKIVFPKGLSVYVNDSLNKAVVDIDDEGRYYLEVTFSESEADVTDHITCELTPSFMFILGVIMPCIVSLIITIILVTTVYLLRKKIKHRKKKGGNGEGEGYEGEEYYVPPPPSS